MKETAGSHDAVFPVTSAPPDGHSATDPASSSYPAYFRDLYAKSGAEKFGLAFPEFAAVLREVSAHYLAPGATESEAAALHQSLHCEELALARACVRGREAAWEVFLIRYRQKLYHAAEAIAKDDSRARELADSLYADLFGTRQSPDGRRISKLASYTGRGSLEGWLRAVLAQEHVNRLRRERNIVSFEERVEAGIQFTAKESTPVGADDALNRAVDSAIDELSAEERLMLAAYYLDGRTLAEVARMLGVHESTVSRRIEKTVTSLRKSIVRELQKRGMSRREAEAALQADVSDLTVDIRRKLVQEKSG